MFFCRAGNVQQAQQSTLLAEGLNPLQFNSTLIHNEVKKLALKLHAHSVHYAHKLVQTRRSLEHFSHLQTNQERSAGLSARDPPVPH